MTKIQITDVLHVLVFVLVLVIGAIPAVGMSRKPPDRSYVPGQVLVKFMDSVTPERVAEIVHDQDGKIQDVLGRTGIYLILIPQNMDVLEAVERFSDYLEVEYAEPNYLAEHPETR